MKITLSLIVVLVLLAGTALTGCNNGPAAIKTDQVTGVVTGVDGQPLAGASINFTPEIAGSGNPAYASTGADGSYKLQTLLGAADAGTTPGDYQVTITKAIMVPTGQKETTPEGVVDVMKSQSVIPDAYGSVKTTPFKAKVVSGKNKFDFTLKADGT